MRKLALILAALIALAGCAQKDVTTTPPAAVDETTLTPGPSGEDTGGEHVAKVGEWATAEDGVEFTVTKLARGRVSDIAAGGRPGNPAVIVTVKIRNSSKERMDLTELSVTVRLGEDGREAEEVYQDDFGGPPDGTLAPGRVSTSRYMFAGKTAAELRMVSVEVSPGWEYDSFTFEGSA